MRVHIEKAHHPVFEHLLPLDALRSPFSCYNMVISSDQEGLCMDASQSYTYADYVKINDDRQYELIGGKLLLVPAPKTGHQRISFNLVMALSGYIRRNNLGTLFYAPVDVVFSETDKPQPDILFIDRERLDIITENYINGPPDLIIEILSPTTAGRDRVQKSHLYYTHGVKEFWLVDPDIKVVEVFTHGERCWNLDGAYGDGDVLHSPLLGLEIELKSIFTV